LSLHTDRRPVFHNDKKQFSQNCWNSSETPVQYAQTLGESYNFNDYQAEEDENDIPRIRPWMDKQETQQKRGKRINMPLCPDPGPERGRDFWVTAGAVVLFREKMRFLNCFV
jgi:hypothetical protein